MECYLSKQVMSTLSLRRDHDLIEEVLKSMWAEVEKSILKEIGKSREDYEKLADDLDKKISGLP